MSSESPVTFWQRSRSTVEHLKQEMKAFSIAVWDDNYRHVYRSRPFVHQQAAALFYAVYRPSPRAVVAQTLSQQNSQPFVPEKSPTTVTALQMKLSTFSKTQRMCYTALKHRTVACICVLGKRISPTISSLLTRDCIRQGYALIYAC